MSLVNKPVLTPEKIAANQANGRRSHGPATPEGRERIREANARHGFYAAGEALRILGEDPEDFEHLQQSLMATWQPADEFQSRLVQRLARAVWRLERSDRMQEGMAVQRLERLDADVDHKAREAGERYQTRLASLNALIDAAGQASFCAGVPELETFHSLWGDKPEGKPGEILILLCRLLKPRPAAGDTTTTEKANLADGPTVSSQPSGEGAVDSGPHPVPGIPIAEGSERYAVREHLLKLLREAIDSLKADHAREREELLQTTAPYYRDAMMAPRKRGALMVRMEDSSFRQIERLTNLLMKLKDMHAAGEPVVAASGRVGDKLKPPGKAGGATSQDEGISHDVIENKG